MEPLPLISVVIPIRNSRAMFEACLQSIRGQDYPSERMEIIVPDAHSTDDGPAIARRFGATVVANDGLMIGPGRDAGFAAARGEIVALTDADCIVDKDWLRNAVKYFQDPAVGAVGGPSPVPPGQGALAEAIGYFFRLSSIVAGAAHVEEQDRIERVRHIPGCNLLCRRSALAKIFPLAWTTTSGEDIQTGRLLLQNGYTLLRVPDVKVWHYKRTTAKAFFWQMQSYGRGRLRLGKIDRRWLHPAHVLCGFAIPLLILGAATLWWMSPVVLLFAALAAAALLHGFALWAISDGASANILWSGPAVLFIGCIGWSRGFLAELFRGPRVTR
ncbi:MAG TPA: glycosyltransferase [Candidatus Peribacteria bacterium]|nr:glycosyltransferase [Candidatus Peribacteria bacterium]